MGALGLRVASWAAIVLLAALATVLWASYQEMHSEVRRIALVQAVRTDAMATFPRLVDTLHTMSERQARMEEQLIAVRAAVARIDVTLTKRVRGLEGPPW